MSAQLVQRVIEALQSGEKAVIPGLPVADTLKSFHLIDEASAGEPSIARYVDATVDRSGLVAVQTPQGFPWSVDSGTAQEGRVLGKQRGNSAY